VNGGELEQIQFLLGHVSVLTTERYLGCKQIWKRPSTIGYVVSSLGRPWIYGKPCSRQVRIEAAETQRLPA
jgi:hypothetical protein